MKPFSLEEYLKNPSRKIVTREGDNVRIVCTDRKHTNNKNIVALCYNHNNDEILQSFFSNGRYSNNCEYYLDLFFTPEKKEGWVNIYKSNSGYYDAGCFYKTKEEAIEHIVDFNNYITTTKIEWEE